MRNPKFLERCFGAVILLALLAIFTAVIFAIADNEPRVPGTTLLLQSRK
ncbi:MAG TPA: hypothetical protein VKU80_12695 [Planctomycetota bacterium]|nr:hypothetical protein [Planctomycetota bacterium]